MNSWQYNGIKSWNEVLGWCLENIKGQFYTNNFETIHFKNESAYILFVLRWS